jgi:hypothetical protein
VLADNQGFSGDTLVPEALDADGTHVTWMVKNRLARVPVGGGQVEELGTHRISPQKLRVVGDYIYAMSAARDAVVRIPKTGGPAENVTPPFPAGVTTLQTFDVIDGAVAWAALREDANGVGRTHLYLCSLPCTEPEEPWSFEDGPSPRAIGRSAKNLYASYYFATGDAEGEGVDCLTAAYKPALVTNFFNEVVVEETPSEALAYGVARGAVARARLPIDRPAGNQPHVPDKVLASDPEMWPRSIALVGNDLYYADSSPGAPGAIVRVDKRGIALAENILSGWSAIVLTASEQAIYFTTTDGKVAKLARPLPAVAKAPDSQN